jgi:hypothetical protein
MPDEWTKTVWQSGDLVTAAKLNKIENQLEYVTENGGGGANDPEIVVVFNTTATTEDVSGGSNPGVGFVVDSHLSLNSELLPYKYVYTEEDGNIVVSSVDFLSTKIYVEFGNGNIYTYLLKHVSDVGNDKLVSFTNKALGGVAFITSQGIESNEDIVTNCVISFTFKENLHFYNNDETEVTSGSIQIPIKISWPNNGKIKFRYEISIQTQEGGGHILV